MLSDGEKLTLLMLCDLCENGNVKGEIDPEFVRSAIYSDYAWALHWKYPFIPFVSKETPVIVRAWFACSACGTLLAFRSARLTS
jgi:uncharacterized protein